LGGEIGGLDWSLEVGGCVGPGNRARRTCSPERMDAARLSALSAPMSFKRSCTSCSSSIMACVCKGLEGVVRRGMRARKRYQVGATALVWCGMLCVCVCVVHLQCPRGLARRLLAVQQLLLAGDEGGAFDVCLQHHLQDGQLAGPDLREGAARGSEGKGNESVRLELRRDGGKRRVQKRREGGVKGNRGPLA